MANWKQERASVTIAGKKRPRSNKYSGGDKTQRPPKGKRKKIWVGGYVRLSRNGSTMVKGHYRKVAKAPVSKD